ncbi:MAG: glucose-1-phosphate adenylyltransferase, partial [Chloroflexota bacterium]|nr:glucose-1-phosphate adenylyltransferase [Chloroflexota bacterium]
AILLQDVIVRAGATVQFAIVDERVEVGVDAKVGEKPRGELPTTEELVLIGANAKVAKAAVVKRGERIEPAAKVKARRKE